MNSNQLSHQYDSIADTFESVYEKGAQYNRRVYRNLVPTIKGGVVLDIGCGDGSDCKFFKDQGADLVYGIDASKELLDIASKKYSGIKFKYGVFDSLPHQDSTFDFVFSKYALQTAEELEPIFKEVYRILKPGGTFTFLVAHPIRQLYEKKKIGKDYFKKEVVDSVCFDGLLTFKEPTHTLKEYFSTFMMTHFTLELFEEQFDPAAEKIVDTYPGYMILQWKKK